jgi:hypothetical protein
LPCAACHHLRSQPRLHTECFKAIQECSNFTLDEIISTYHSNEYPQIVDIKNTSNEFKKLVDGMIYLDDQVARVACVNNSATITQIVKNEKYTKIRYIKFNIDTIKTVIPELKLAIRIHQNGNEVFKTEVILKNAYNSELIVLNDDIAINIGEFKVIITKYDIANSNIAFHTTANNKLAMIIG